MTSTKLLKTELNKALQEIGAITPWWSEDDEMFIFEHDAYPFVVHGDKDASKVKEGYIRALTGFIEERLADNVAEGIDKVTSGRGGFREGAGRPKGTTKDKTLRIYLPEDIARWLKNKENQAQVYKLMQG